MLLHRLVSTILDTSGTQERYRCNQSVLKVLLLITKQPQQYAGYWLS